MRKANLLALRVPVALVLVLVALLLVLLLVFRSVWLLLLQLLLPLQLLLLPIKMMLLPERLLLRQQPPTQNNFCVLGERPVGAFFFGTYPPDQSMTDHQC